jgi:hypothetical protein
MVRLEPPLGRKLFRKLFKSYGHSTFCIGLSKHLEEFLHLLIMWEFYKQKG